MTILIILSILVFFLASLVFGTSAVSSFKKDVTLSLGFLTAFIYSAISFAIQVNGFVVCRAQNALERCIQYPEATQIPIVRVGFNLISSEMRSFLSIVLTFSIIFFLMYLFKQQSNIFGKKDKNHTHNHN